MVEHVFMPRPAALARAEAVPTADAAAPAVERRVLPGDVTALAKGTNVLAYSMKKVIGFVSVSRQVFQSHMCYAVRSVTQCCSSLTTPFQFAD